MLEIEHRQMYRPNGLIDDLVLRGKPADYLTFASQVETAISSGGAEALPTASRIHIEILNVSEQHELFTSLQNQNDCYSSLNDWNQRNILRILGSTAVLERLRTFLVDLSGRGEGYSYMSEYSEECAYSMNSPEWRLHVQLT